MQENNLLNGNSTNDIQGVKSTYALVILISSIETENQLSYCESTIVKQPIKMVIVMVMHYFHSVLENGLPPSLNVNHNTYSTLPRKSMARVKAWHAAQRNILIFPELSECTIL